MALVHHLFGDDPNSRPVHDHVASAVFTTPQIGNVGLTEEEAVKEYPNLNIFKSVFRCVPEASPCSCTPPRQQCARCSYPKPAIPKATLGATPFGT